MDMKIMKEWFSWKEFKI